MRRRRRCKTCGFRFTTFETIERSAILDRHGRRRSFQPARLERSLAALRAVELDEHKIERIVAGIERRMDAQGDTVDTNLLVRWVAAELPDRVMRARYLENVGQLTPQDAERSARGEVRKRERDHTGERPRVWFDREKLRDSIEKAAFTLIPADEVEEIVNTIEQRVIEAEDAIETTVIRGWIEEALKQRKELAWIRYAAGHPEANLEELLRKVTHTPYGHIRKSNDVLEPFDKERLRNGVKMALGKRQLDADFWMRFDQLADQVAQEVMVSREPMTTGVIVNRILSWLKENDDVAFLSFLILHRDLKATEVAGELARWGIKVTPTPGAGSS